MARILLRDLQPGMHYYVQVRSVNGEKTSLWSRSFEFNTITDDIPPDPISNLSWTTEGTAFLATWDAPTTNEGGVGEIMDLKDFEIILYPTDVPSFKIVYYQTSTRFEFGIEANRAAFNTPRGDLTIEIRARDETDNLSAPVIAQVANDPPQAPQNVTATPIMDGVDLSWDANTIDQDFVRFEVFQSIVSGFTPSEANKVYSGPGNSYTHFTAGVYVPLYFVVKSVDVFELKGTAPQVMATPGQPYGVDTTPPDVPSNVTATWTADANDPAGATGTFDVSWTASTSTDVTYYVVSYSTNGTTWSYVNGIDGNRTLIRGLRAGQTYYIRVKAVDVDSNSSAWVNNGTYPQGSPADVNAPVAPTGVAISGGLQTVTVTWNENAEADVKNGAGQYEVQIDTANTFATGALKTVRVGGLVTSFNNLSAGATYFARVRAIDSSGNIGAWSTIVSTSGGTITADNTDNSAPASSPTPTVLSAFSALVVRWPTVVNADPLTYEVHVSAATGFTPSASTKVGEVDGTFYVVKSLTDGTALAYGTTYYVKIIAKDADGSAPAGTQASGTTSRVDTGDIAANAIVSNHITVGTLAGDRITVGTLDGDRLVANSVKAAKIDVNDLFARNATVSALLTMGATDGGAGAIQSFDWNDTSKKGWRIDSNGITIHEGTVSATALSIGDVAAFNRTDPAYSTFEFAPYFYALDTGSDGTISWAITTAQSKFHSQSLSITRSSGTYGHFVLGRGTTQNISVEPDSTYIVSMYVKGSVAGTIGLLWRGPDSAGTLQNNSFATGLPVTTEWTRVSVVTTTPANIFNGSALMVNMETTGTVYIDGVQVEDKLTANTTPTYYKIPGYTTINGGIIRTGEIRSTAAGPVDGQPAWSLSMTGNATLNDALVRGKVTVGAAGASNNSIAVSSYGYGLGGAQWAIRGDGTFDIKSGTGARVQLSSGGFTASNGSIDTVSILTNGTFTFRTGTNGVIFDANGLRVTDVNGTPRVSLNSDGSAYFTGDITGASGNFSGTVAAENLVGSTISGKVIVGNDMYSDVAGTSRIAIAAGTGRSKISWIDSGNAEQGYVYYYYASASSVLNHRLALFGINGVTINQSGSGAGKGTLFVGTIDANDIYDFGNRVYSASNPPPVTSHSHDYAASFHTHDYAPSSHSHNYALSVHDHGAIYNYGTSSGSMGLSDDGSSVRIHSAGNSWFRATRGKALNASITGATDKAFIIDHPNPAKADTHYLHHSCLEGPTADVYYRGEAQLTFFRDPTWNDDPYFPRPTAGHGAATITLPDYFEDIAREEGRTVSVTPILGCDDADCPFGFGDGEVADLVAPTLAVTRVKNGQFVVRTTGGYNHGCASFFWEVKAIRKDVELYDAEPLKSESKVVGDGPYTYMVPA